MLRGLEYWLVVGICLTCAMHLWQFDFGLRMTFAELLVVAFILIRIVSLIKSEARVIFDKRLEKLSLWYFVLWVLGAMTAIIVLKNADSDLAWRQYFRYMISDLAYSVFAILFARFAAEIGAAKCKRLVGLYVYATIASCMFELAEVSLGKWFGIDLLRIVFEPISFNARIFDQETLLLEWGDFYRGSGFAGPNAQGAYIASAVTLMILGFGPKRATIKYGAIILALIAQAITMSRTGLLVLISGALALLVLHRHRLIYAIPGTVLVAGTLVCLYLMFASEADELALTRSGMDYSRLELFQGALEIAKANAFGIGVGQYFVLFWQGHDLAFDANVHNTWLQILVEKGWLGLGLSVGFYVFLLLQLGRIPLRSGKAGFATILGLMAGSLTSTFFTLLFPRFCTILLFCHAVVDDAEQRRKQEKVGLQSEVLDSKHPMAHRRAPAARK